MAEPYIRRDTPTVMSGMVVRYEMGNLEVSASRYGVMLQGASGAMEDLGRLLKVLDWCHLHYRSMSQGYDPIPQSELGEGHVGESSR